MNKWYTGAFGALLFLSSGLTTWATDVDPSSIVFRLVEPESGVQAGRTEEVKFDISSPVAFQGFSASLVFDPDVFDILGHNSHGTIIASIGDADFVDFKIDDEVGTITIGVLLRTTRPPDVTIPGVGFPMTMMNIEVAVPEDVPTQVSRFRFVDGLGTPPKFNVLVHDNTSERPDRQEDALIQVFGLAPFIRGDANQNGGVDMVDAIFLLRVIVLGMGEFECEKAADINDTAHIDLTDAVYLLQFLFLGADPIPPPYPEPGFDNRPERLDLHCPTSFFSSQ